MNRSSLAFGDTSKIPEGDQKMVESKTAPFIHAANIADTMDEINERNRYEAYHGQPAPEVELEEQEKQLNEAIKELRALRNDALKKLG